MKIEVDYEGEDRGIVIKEVFSGAYIETAEGNRIGFCMRDDTIEFNVLPKAGGYRWFRIDMGDLTVKAMSTEADEPQHAGCPSMDGDPV